MGSELEEDYDEIIENYISFVRILEEGRGFIHMHVVLRLTGGTGIADLDMALARKDLLNDDHEAEEEEEKKEKEGIQLLKAAQNGDEVRVTELLASKPILIYYRIDGNTVLHVAAMLGNRSLVKKLIDFINADKSKVFPIRSPHLVLNDDEYTALALALKFKHKEVASDLMMEMPEPKIVYAMNKCEETPIMLAMRAGYMDLVQDMLKRAPWSSFCHRTRQILLHSPIVRDAINIKGLGMLQIVLDNMPALAESTFEGWTPLFYAIIRGDADKVRYLLKKFPNLASKCDNNGDFPIHKAIYDVDVIKELISCVPETLFQVNGSGRTILHLVVEYTLPITLSYLRTLPELNKILHYKDNSGDTFLDLVKDLMGIYFTKSPQTARKQPELSSLQQQMEELKSPQVAQEHPISLNTKQQMKKFEIGPQAAQKQPELSSSE